MDSSGKIPTGLLNGNIINLGDYDQCVSTSSEMNESTPFHGQYCLVSLVIEVPPEIIFVSSFKPILITASKPRTYTHLPTFVLLIHS